MGSKSKFNRGTSVLAWSGTIMKITAKYEGISGWFYQLDGDEFTWIPEATIEEFRNDYLKKGK